MNFSKPLQIGRLVRRYKRFLADIECEDGSVVTVHCPNSGSMMGLKELGLKVAFSMSDNPNRKLPYTLEMVQVEGAWVGVNTQWPNKLFQNAFVTEKLEAFKLYEACQPEVRVGVQTRLDFLLTTPTQRCYVEVKNVTLMRNEGCAEFPDAVTLRGAKHLQTLMDLSDQGDAASLVFMVQREDCTRFRPACDIDPSYAKLLHQAYQKGVVVIAYSCKVSPTGINIIGELPLELEI